VQRPALLLAFGVFGFLFGIWQVVLPDLTLALGLDAAALGLALSVGFLGSFPAMWLAGGLVDRLGATAVMTAMAAVIGGCFTVLALIPSYPVLIATLLVFYAASGAYDIAVNAAALRYEQTAGGHLLTQLHAAFSGGAMVGAIVAGLGVVAGAPFNLLYLSVPLALGGAMVAVRRAHLPGPSSTRSRTPSTRTILAPIIVALGIVAAAATLSESALESWSAIYLRLTLGFPAVLGAAGVATFHAAMFTGRAAGTPVVEAVGRPRALLLAGAVAAISMPVALATTAPAIVLFGLFCVAIGLSVLFPVAVSLAGSVAGTAHGQAAAAVISIGYAGFVVGPAVIGLVAAAASLRLALLVVTVAGLVTVVLAGRPLARLPR
jgi:MFS family permease